MSEGPELTYRTTCKGVTPFSFGQEDLHDDTMINDLFDQLSQTTVVMPADTNKLAKMPASVPETVADFIQNLKVFGNLLYALFTSTFPLIKQLKELIKV